MKKLKAHNYIFSILLLIAIWKVLSLVIDSPVLPPPEAAFVALGDAVKTSAFWMHFKESAVRVVISIIISLIIAFPLGIALGYNSKLDRLIAPMLFLTYPIPKIVFLPVLFVLFGLGNLSKVALITAIISYQLLVIIRDGAANINKKHVETIRSMGGNQFHIIRHVLIPGTFPSCFTALRLSTGTAITVLFLAETYATNRGLGYFIINSWSKAAYDELFVGIIGMSLLGIIFYGIFSSLEKGICHWKMLESIKVEERKNENRRASVASTSTESSLMKGSWPKMRAWYRASRPFTLNASLAPVIVGSALAFREGIFNPGIFAMVLVASVLVQIAANLVDEYSDHNRPERKNKLIAPYKVIALGILSPTEVKLGAIVCFTISTLIGLYLVVITGWPLLIICLLSAAAAYFHSAGRVPLGSVGLGHLLVFLFMGPVIVVGSYYAQTRILTAEALWLSIPVACGVTAILVANDIRDLEEDRAAGKKTLVTLWGRGFGRWEWTLLLAVAFLIPVALAVVGGFGLLVLLPFIALPQAVKTLQAIWHGRERRDFALALQLSSRLHGYLGLLLGIGVGLGYFFIF